MYIVPFSVSGLTPPMFHSPSHPLTTKRKHTHQIATISIVVLSQINLFLTPNKIHHLVVDNEIDSHVRVHFDVTFPYVDCEVLTMDVMDDNGRHNEEVSLDNVHKRPLSSSGEIDKAVDPVKVQKGTALQTVGDLSKKKNSTEVEKKCGDCYGAHGPMKRHKRRNQKGCCNTCNDIKLAYDLEGWKFDSVLAATIPLCQGDVLKGTVWEGPGNSRYDKTVRGCNVEGYVDVPRISGSIHFSPGSTLRSLNGIFSLSALLEMTTTHFDLTHRIDRLSFGTYFLSLSLSNYLVVSRIRTRTHTHTHTQYRHGIPRCY